jgi:hypothetical protein
MEPLESPCGRLPQSRKARNVVIIIAMGGQELIAINMQVVARYSS